MEDLVKYDKVIDQGMRYNFIPYETPRIASYNHSTNEYDLTKGWLNEPKKVLVIGETKRLIYYRTQTIRTRRVDRSQDIIYIYFHWVFIKVDLYSGKKHNCHYFK